MAIPEPHGIPSISEQRTNHIIKSLNADLRAAAADLAAAENRVKALEADMQAIISIIDTDLDESWHTNLNAAIKQLLNDEIAIKVLCMEALQVKEAE